MLMARGPGNESGVMCMPARPVGIGSVGIGNCGIRLESCRPEEFGVTAEIGVKIAGDRLAVVEKDECILLAGGRSLDVSRLRFRSSGYSVPERYRAGERGR